MKVTRTEIPDVMLIEPRVFGDARGFFFESFNQRVFADATGSAPSFARCCTTPSTPPGFSTRNASAYTAS